MDMTASMTGDTVVVSVNAARIDAAVAIRFKDSLRQVVPARACRVVLDLGQVEFLDSSGLGAIVSVMKQLGPERRLDLAALQPNVDRVFRLTRLDAVFDIHADAAEALKSHAN